MHYLPRNAVEAGVHQSYLARPRTIDVTEVKREETAKKYQTDHKGNRRIDDFEHVKHTMIETAHTFDQHACKAVKKEANDVQEGGVKGW